MVTTVMKPAACFVRAGTVTEKRAPAPTVVWRDTLEVVVTKVSHQLVHLVITTKLLHLTTMFLCFYT